MPLGVLWRAVLALAALTAPSIGANGAAHAGAALQISPVLIDLTAPAATATVEITDQAPQPAPVQVRIFKWTQANGQETLTPTDDVVASPPIATIAPGTKLSIRVIRTSKAPIVGEEAYRLVIDQLPEPNPNGRAVVAMLLRQVLPVFFASPDRGKPQVAWTISKGAKGFVLHARNAGDRRVRIAKITLNAPGRRAVSLGGGLLGYALGHSDMSWSIADRTASFPIGGQVAVHGDSDSGALNATALVTAGE